MALAKAMAMAGGALYAICALAIVALPNLARGMFNSWFHGIDMSVLPMRGVPLGPTLWGLVTFSLFSWIFGYVLAYFYNMGARK